MALFVTFNMIGIIFQLKICILFNDVDDTARNVFVHNMNVAIFRNGLLALSPEKTCY